MEIFLVRHGIAEDLADAEAEGRGESGRRLTDEGREKTTKVAHAFRKRVSEVDVIFHSPYARAAETAKIFAAEFPEAKVKQADGLTPNDSPKAALKLMGAFDDEGRVMVVGHEPHLSAFASLLLTGKEGPILEFKKAGVAAIDCIGPISNCRLQFLLSPKWL